MPTPQLQSSFFSLYGAIDHRDLHSFPTRRSSDLQSARRARRTAPTYLLRPMRRADWRSEEHTSELQSLRHLVCRLLLEKKKRHADQDSRAAGSTHEVHPATHQLTNARCVCRTRTL